MRSAVTIALTVVALAGTASGQPALEPPGLVPAGPAGQQAPQVRDDEVSENAALAISIGGTALSYGMLVVSARAQIRGGAGEALVAVGALGTLFAPSAGRWYAHARGWRGLGLRLAGVGTGALAAAVALSECRLYADNPGCHATWGTVLGIAAAGLYLGGTIDDFVMAPRDARRHNERLRQVAVVPLVRPDDRGLGVAIAAQF